MNETFEITRRTRKVGWGYTCWTKPGDMPSKPDVTGTVKQCFDYICDCRDYQSMKSGGTYLAEQWFYNGKPVEFAPDKTIDLNELFFGLIDSYFGGEYLWDSISVKFA